MSAGKLTRDEVAELIQSAFLAVELGEGLSLRQAKAVDNREEQSCAAFRKLRESDEVRDWRRVLMEDLEKYPYLPHMDAAGFRYYIPAFIMALLECYRDGSGWTMSTLLCLRPKRDTWEHSMHHYELLSTEQRQAIAVFLEALPSFVDLDTEDGKLVSRALRDYWGQFLTC
ncbi:MAG: DUF6714 family protein [Verrucomicrobiales bacterium]|nr:hypothetical protein [Verrucomicrobiae bacterium]